jgi:formyl-CoA transferase
VSALDDLLVIDTTASFWASAGVAMLADFGARVVQVELPPLRDAVLQDAALETPPHDALAHRNKERIALDLSKAEGRRVLEQLVARADVFATDAPTPVLEEHRLDYKTLATLRGDLVYARGSGFGRDGPDREAPALDELAAARTGVMPTLPQPGQPPVYAASGQMYSAVMLAFGIMTALWHRAETGEGQEVDVSLLGGNMYGASLDLQAFLAMGGERFLQPVDRLDAGNPMSGTLYPTSDGLWVTLTMPDTDRWWPGLAEITGLDVDDARFNSHEKRCETNRLDLIATLERAFRQRPADHWRNVIDEKQLSADVIEDYSYPANDAQALRNEFIIEQGGVKALGFPIYMSETPALLRNVGQSNGALRDLLGYSDDDLARMRGKGAIS